MQEYYWFAVFAGINGLLILLLAVNVSRLRITKKIPYGDSGDAGANQAIRAHANAVEHVTIYGLMLLGLSLLQAAGSLLPGLVLAFTLGRLIHAWGMLGRIFNARRLGAAVTYLCELAAVMTLFAALLTI